MGGFANYINECKDVEFELKSQISFVEEKYGTGMVYSKPRKNLSTYFDKSPSEPKPTKNKNQIKSKNKLGGLMTNTPTNEIVPKTEKVKIDKKQMINYLIDSYGTIENCLKIVNSILDSNNNKMFKFIKRVLPVFMYGKDIYKRATNFINNTNLDKELNIHDQISIMINIPSVNNIIVWSNNDLEMSEEVDAWLQTLPKSNEFKIHSFCSLSKNIKLDCFDTFYDDICYVITYEKINYLLKFNNRTKGTTTRTSFSCCMFDGSEGNGRSLGKMLNREYSKTLNFKEYVLMYDINIKKKKRVKNVNLNFKTMGYEKLKNEIESTLSNDQRRGIMLAGNPGTGKTSVVKKLESELTDFPFFYITPRNLHSEGGLAKMFDLIKILSKSVVVFEDFDSFSENGEKTKQIGVLLNYISDPQYKCVYIATVNDTKKINYALLRSGRFDKLVEVKEPNDTQEIYDIMKIHYENNKSTNDYHKDKEFIKKSDLSWLTYWRLKRKRMGKNFTQADYCEICNSIMLNRYDFTNENVILIMKELIMSRDLIKKYERVDE